MKSISWGGGGGEVYKLGGWADKLTNDVVHSWKAIVLNDNNAQCRRCKSQGGYVRQSRH